MRAWMLALVAMLPAYALAQTNPGFVDLAPPPPPGTARGLRASDLNSAFANKLDVNNPRVSTGSMVFNLHPFGTKSTACALGIIVNHPNGDGYCEVLGYDPGPAAYAAYPYVDTVALFMSNTNGPPPVANAAATYPDPLTVAFNPPLTAAQLASLKPGMHARSSDGLLTQIASIDPAGKSVTVYGWAAANNPAPGQKPGSNATVSLGINDTVFAGNFVVGLQPGGGPIAHGIEMDLLNQSNTNPDGLWGYDCITLTTYSGGTCFMARGPNNVGFRAKTGSQGAFVFDPEPATSPAYVQTGSAFVSYDTSFSTTPDALGKDFAVLAPGGGTPSFRVTNTGKMVGNGIVLNGNMNGAPPPAIQGQAYLGWNYQNAEVDYFNTAAGAVNSHAWWQWNGTSYVRVGALSAAGQLSTALGFLGPLVGPVTIPPATTGASQPSGNIQLNSTDAAGAAHQAYVAASATGDLVLNTPTGTTRPTAFAIPLGAPASGTAPCTPGQNLQSGSYLYSCLSPNRWGRVIWDMSW